MSFRITRNLQKYLPEGRISLLRLGIREMIVNAIEHGNLGITYEEKSLAQKNQTYHDLLRERQMSEQNRKKRVHISYELSEQMVRYVIRDEGFGFNHHGFIDDLPFDANEQMHLFIGIERQIVNKAVVVESESFVSNHVAYHLFGEFIADVDSFLSVLFAHLTFAEEVVVGLVLLSQRFLLVGDAEVAVLDGVDDHLPDAEAQERDAALRQVFLEVAGNAKTHLVGDREPVVVENDRVSLWRNSRSGSSDTSEANPMTPVTLPFSRIGSSLN